MYIPYRKAYISGMNPLSFVTVFTFGELGTVFALALVFDGGFQHVVADLGRARPVLFWLFLGGFCWVIGDLFQQYAAKYIGIGRGIPLSNTNQLWGLAWGALVFGELAGQGAAAQTLVIAGSMIMICGAVAISFAEAPESEHSSWREAMDRECVRYGLDSNRVADAVGAATRSRPAGPALVGVPRARRGPRNLRLAGHRRRSAANIRESRLDGTPVGRDNNLPGSLRPPAMEADTLFLADVP